MALQLLHGPVEEAVDGLVIVLLVGRLDDQGDRTVNCPRVHCSYYYSGGEEGSEVSELDRTIHHFKVSPFLPHGTDLTCVNDGYVTRRVGLERVSSLIAKRVWWGSDQKAVERRAVLIKIVHIRPGRSDRKSALLVAKLLR